MAVIRDRIFIVRELEDIKLEQRRIEPLTEEDKAIADSNNSELQRRSRSANPHQSRARQDGSGIATGPWGV